ncbi:MAG: hypothetical protein U1E70_04000 [Acetobacteraceae bacterium]
MRYWPWMAAMGAVSLGLAATSPADAAVIIDLTIDGGSVRADAAGKLDVSSLQSLNPSSNASLVAPSHPAIVVGQGGLSDEYTGFTSTPSAFGPAVYVTNATFSSGQTIGAGPTVLAVPYGYVSGADLTAASIFQGHSFLTLGVTPGTYIWAWGAGDHADSLTLNIIAPPIFGSALPEPASLLLLAGPAVAALAVRRRRVAGRGPLRRMRIARGH